MNPLSHPTFIQWRDLCKPNRWHSLLEILRPILLCAASVYAAHQGLYLMCSLLLLWGHIAALRSAHGAVHNSIGLPYFGNQTVLYGVSALLATSCHALELTHKLHHKRCGQPEDVEGRIAHCGFWRACAVSPNYYWRVIQAAWRLGDSNRRRSITLDLMLAVILHSFLLAVVGNAMLVVWLGLAILNGASGLLSVWLFHRGGEVTRSAHWRVLNYLAMGMLYHAEHHRFPGVPTARLGKLARRMTLANAQPPALISFKALSYNKALDGALRKVRFLCKEGAHV